METISNASISRINPGNLRKLSSLNAARSVLPIVIEWSIIVACIFLHTYFTNIWVYLLIYFIIGSRLYALYSLIHEAIHYLIAKNRKANDFISQVFLGFPLFINLSRMRQIHFDHHKYLHTEKDPEMKLLAYHEFQFPKKPWQLLYILFLDLTGLNFLYYKILKISRQLRHPFQLIQQEYMAITLIVISLFVSIYFNAFKSLLLYWWLPYIGIYQLLNRMRLAAEHFNIDKEKEIKTRTVVPNFIQKLTIIPYNLGYHTEHHLYPGVPQYNLPELQEILLVDEHFKAAATIEHGYFSILNRYIKE